LGYWHQYCLVVTMTSVLPGWDILSSLLPGWGYWHHCLHGWDIDISIVWLW
jgi:hypothetical protein